MLLETATTVAAVAFVVNVPLGKWRSFQRKLSPKWFLAIHLSIPLIVLLRIFLHVPFVLAPAFVVAAGAGQIVGARAPIPWPGKRVSERTQ